MNNTDAVFIVAICLGVLFTLGEPDLLDGIIHWLYK